MNGTSERTIYAGLYLPTQEVATTAAIIKLQRTKGIERGAFAYGLGYLDNPAAIALNPDHLPLQRAAIDLEPRLLRDGGAMPLTIRDALPDAWGRLVIAHELGGRVPADDELLLLTNDDRVGAMVFAECQAMPPASPPPRFQIQDLADAVRRLQYDMEIPTALRRLLLRGGSLGGARPKASFIHQERLWLAKFPARDDPLDVEALEAATMALALHCGIRVPRWMLVPTKHGDRAFLSERFDRVGPVATAQRLHYLSASALLDIPYESSGGSYVQLARVLRRISVEPAEDLRELFRRMAFNILIDNSDDHLKNHGVLYAGKGRYRLSPAFDIVPQLSNLGYLMLSIDGESDEASLDRAVRAAPHFGLGLDEAARIVAGMADTAYGMFRSIASAAHISPAVIERAAACFKRQAAIVGAPAQYR